MSTQLRLITKPGAAKTPTPRPLRARRTPATPAGRTPARPAGRARRAVHWQGQWRLDDQARNIGKAGVASAREALARAHPDAEYRAAS